MARVIKVEVGDGAERRMEKMRIGSLPYERVLQDIEAMYNMPRGTCRLYLVDRNGEEVAIGATSWDDLEFSEDIRARFYVSSTSPRQRSTLPPNPDPFSFDQYALDQYKPSRSRRTRSPSPGFNSFYQLLSGVENPRSTSRSRHPFHDTILQSPRSVSFDMTGLEDKEHEDLEMKLDDSLDAQNHSHDYSVLYADSIQPSLSYFDHTYYSEQNQLPTPASSPPPHEQSFDRSRSSSRRSSYSHYTSTITSHSPTLANPRRSPSTSPQSSPVSTQTRNEAHQNEILTRARKTAHFSDRQALSTSPRRPASPARDISPRSSSSSRRIASPRPSLELTFIHPSLPSSTTFHSMPARRQFSRDDYISSPQHCARSPERWC
ncbi:hypothetical protein JCM5353_008437 [Sporobolomyces roseus]